MGELSKATMDRVLKEAGAKRISKKASLAFAKALEKIALEIGERAAALSKHANRKTIIPQDIRLAKKKVVIA